MNYLISSILNFRNILKSLFKTILKTKRISLKKLLITSVMQPLATTIIIFRVVGIGGLVYIGLIGPEGFYREVFR